MMYSVMRWTILALSTLQSTIGDGANLSTPLALHKRDDLNTTWSNAPVIVHSLDYTSNCTLSILWYEHLPSNKAEAGSGSDTINIDFLRSALPSEYQNNSDAQISSFYDGMSSQSLKDLGWLGTAKDDIETACITPKFEQNIKLTDLDVAQNCTATAIFLSSLGWITGAQNYTSSSNDTAWLGFLRATLPLPDQKNLTDLELLVYRNYFLASENDQDIDHFLQKGFNACKESICEVQGYTGNPDIGGIGVISSYTVEAALVTLYFVAINLQALLKHIGPGYRYPRRIEAALAKASDELADGALFFSLSISTAGWVSFVSGKSYYEKLVFTSANVLALSALFAFLGMFTAEGRKRRGELILALMIAGILIESAIQYIVYLKEPNDKYADYQCLNGQFRDEGYHPAIFEALFFLLLGLSVLAAIVGSVWLYRRSKTEKSTHSDRASVAGKEVRISTIESWVTATRIIIQTVAIAVMWVELVYLWKIRKIMARIAGDTWSEGTWGFGQILTLFIWLPPIVTILGYLLLPERLLGGDNKREDVTPNDTKNHGGATVAEKTPQSSVGEHTILPTK